MIIKDYDTFLNRLFGILSIGNIAAAIFHITRIFYPDPFIFPHPSTLRHILFIIINLLCFIALNTNLKQTGFFLFSYIVLTIQQIYSHGRILLFFKHTHWPSIMIIIFVPFTLGLLLWNYRIKTTNF